MLLIAELYLQAENLIENNACDEHPDVNVERQRATLYCKRWLQKCKRSRVGEVADSDNKKNIVVDMERADGFNSLELDSTENDLSKFALITAQTKHFYPLDKRKLVGRHADEGGIWALRDLSLALEYGETFGLLGPNGAGKSTLISILSGILKSTHGLQFIGGQSLQSLENNVHNVVGFCPQFDVVWNNLSGTCSLCQV